MRIGFHNIPTKMKPGDVWPVALRVTNKSEDAFEVTVKLVARKSKSKWSGYLGTMRFDVGANSDQVYPSNIRFKMPDNTTEISALAEVKNKTTGKTRRVKKSKKIYVL